MRLVWDQIGERLYHVGVEKGVLFPMDSKGTYAAGCAWNGLTAVNESPSGAEPTKLYANNRVYGTIYSKEEFGGTIEAYMYPDEFAECDGSAALATGVRIGQQKRKPFGLAYRTNIGNDTEGEVHDYEIHLVYNAMVSPSEQNHGTINENVEPEAMSWEFSTTPVEVEGYEPTSHIVITASKTDEAKLKQLEDMIYGTDGESEGTGTASKLPTPAEVIALFKEAAAQG